MKTKSMKRTVAAVVVALSAAAAGLGVGIATHQGNAGASVPTQHPHFCSCIPNPSKE